LFVLGVGATWYNWTQVVEPVFPHQSLYLPALLTALCGWGVALVLALAAPLLRRTQRSITSADSGAAALARIAATRVAFPWFGLAVPWPLWARRRRAVPAIVPLLLALIWRLPALLSAAVGRVARDGRIGIGSRRPAAHCRPRWRWVL
jgi:hypothetical protein